MVLSRDQKFLLSFSDFYEKPNNRQYDFQFKLRD